MKTRGNSSRKILWCLWLLIIVSSLLAFCLSITLIRSKQHIIQYGYRISQLESSCATYGVKISELDKEILRLNVAIIPSESSNWIKNATVHHVKKRDVQYFALSKKLGSGRTVAHNLKR